MKETFAMFAQYNKEANKTIFSILDKLSNDEREKDRGSFYGSLSGLFRHLLSATFFFLRIFKGALAEKTAALKTLETLSGIKLPKDTLNAEQWKSLESSLDTIDSVFINLLDALSEADLSLTLKIEWYCGKEVPVSFLLSQLVMHGTHHRGQISQILDELKIDNDYSGINVAFLPKSE
jgi:uncharacterized damage-inducible protein DinB